MQPQKSYKGFIIWLISFFAAVFFIVYVLDSTLFCLFSLHFAFDIVAETVGMIAVALRTVKIKLK